MPLRLQGLKGKGGKRKRKEYLGKGGGKRGIRREGEPKRGGSK